MTTIAEASPEIEMLVARFYAAFDNRGARTVDVDALRGLFIPQAMIVRAANGEIETMTLDAFLAPRIQMLSDGTLEQFHEWEESASTLRCGNIACRQSAYRKAGTLRGDVYRGGGRKLIQLVRSHGKWLIASILWEDIPDLDA